MRIFVSSTSLDLEHHRRAVIDAISRAGHTPVCMEHHAAGDVAPKDEVLRDVATCEAYVGVFAWRYGFIPPGSDTSITEMEYREAIKRRVRALVFLSADEAGRPTSKTSGDDSRRIHALREELKLTKWCRPFTTPDSLAAEVLAAVMRVMDEAFRNAQAAPVDQVRRPQRTAWASVDDRACAVHSRVEGPKHLPNPFPKELTRRFHGREMELSKLRLCLDDRNLRMVSICGRGGIGKTTLVSKLLSDVQFKEEVPEGSSRWSVVDSVVYASLAEVGFRTPDRLVDLVAHTLEPGSASELNDLWSRAGSSLQERLAALFRGPLSRRRIVFVLDNLESVLDDENRITKEYAPLGELIEAFLKYEHTSLLIVTTRRSLSLSVNAEIAAIGRRVQISLDQGLPTDSATALIRELDSDGRLGIRDASQDVLDAVVGRCQGIPKTIEAFVGTLLQRTTWTLNTLLANEPHMIRLMEDPVRELFASLSANQQLVAQVLSVYGQPVSNEAVRSILPSLAIDDILDILVNKFVVTHDHGRYWLHPLDRWYAYRHIPDQGSQYSRPELHKRAAEFFRTIGKPVDHCRTIQDLDPQLNEVQHLVHAACFDEACRVLNEIDREYLATWGHTHVIIGLRSQLSGQISDRRLQSLNEGNLGCSYFESGQPLKAKECFGHALSVARELDDKALAGRWMGNLGLACHSLGSADEAIDLLGGALAIARAVNDCRHENRWLGHLTLARLRLGQVDVQEAIGNLKHAISLAQNTSDRRFVMVWAHCLGDIFFGLGQLSTAKEQIRSALEAARHIGARGEICRMFLQLGMIHGKLGEASQQAESFEQAREVLGEMQHSAEKGNALLRLAGMYAELGHTPRQLQCYDDALKVASEIGDRAAERRLLLTLGDIWRQMHNREKAEECYQLSLAKATTASDVSDECNALLRLAAMAVESGDKQRAIKRYEQALLQIRGASDRAGEAVVLGAYANALLSMGEPIAAIRYYEAALPIVSEMNDRTSQSHIFNRLGMAAHLIRDIPQAIVYYEKMLEIARETGNTSGQAIALHDIGSAYHVAGEIAQAMAHYQEAIDLNVPGIAYKCALGLGQGCLQIGKRQEAFGYFDQCISVLGNLDRLSFHPELGALGVALLAVGRTEEGIDVYRRGLALRPTTEEVNYGIEDLRFLEGVKPPISGVKEAIEMLVNALTLGPSGDGGT